MRLHNSAWALLAIPAVHAVSLADFTPRPSKLPASCQTVYTQTIDGCSADDWSSGTSSKGCSKGCVDALSALTGQVESACANQGITGQNIIVAFLGGRGPQSLCSNAAKYLSGNTDSSSSAASTSSQVSSTSATPSATPSSTMSTSTTKDLPTSAILSGTVTATSLATTGIPTNAPSGGILVDSSTQPPSRTGALASSQTFMAESGGGSPFDSEGNTSSGAGALYVSLATTLGSTLFVLITALR